MVSFKCCIGFGSKHGSGQWVIGDDNDVDDEKKMGEIKHGLSTVQRFGWVEIEKMTRNFSHVIGSGGFSTVYSGRVNGSGSELRAFKVSYGSERLNRVFKQELDILVQLDHVNIVKLLGYCDDRDEGVLVFEHLSNGSLQDNLHGTTGKKKPHPLSWKTRMSIAYQLAKAIEYLHEKCTPHIVHCDIKASNILLDTHLNNIKLCDFGSAKRGFSSSIVPPSLPSYLSPMRQMMMMGSPGYVDPHYLRTGIASKKNDIYGFGVVLLELLTGKEAFSPDTHLQLTAIIKPLLNNGDCGGIDVAKMVDPKLGGCFDMEEAKAMAVVSEHCLRQMPSLRPSSSEILQTMKQHISSISSSLS